MYGLRWLIDGEIGLKVGRLERKSIIEGELEAGTNVKWDSDQ